MIPNPHNQQPYYDHFNDERRSSPGNIPYDLHEANNPQHQQLPQYQQQQHHATYDLAHQQQQDMDGLMQIHQQAAGPAGPPGHMPQPLLDHQQNHNNFTQHHPPPIQALPALHHRPPPTECRKS